MEFLFTTIWTCCPMEGRKKKQTIHLLIVSAIVNLNKRSQCTAVLFTLFPWQGLLLPHSTSDIDIINSRKKTLSVTESLH